MIMLADEHDYWQDCWHLTNGNSGQGKRLMNDLLLPSEVNRASAYNQKYLFLPEDFRCHRDDLVVHLGDSPQTGWTTWSGVSGVMPTIRRSGGLYYVPQLCRHLTLREMYLSMGYPTFVRQLGQDPTMAYRVFIPGTSWWDARRALGNSMHVAQVGVVVGSLLISSRLKGEELPLSELLSIVDMSLGNSHES